jgi:hypothetical protein
MVLRELLSRRLNGKKGLGLLGRPSVNMGCLVKIGQGVIVNPAVIYSQMRGCGD